MGAKFDALLGALREKDTGTNTLTLTEYDNADPSSPAAGDVWVRKDFTTDGIAGTPRGALMGLTYAGAGVTTYQLSYESVSDGIKRTTLS